MSARSISLFGSRLRPCPYLPGRQERNVAAELNGPDSTEIYDAAVRAGFRRSHDIIYRPACPGCEACVPVRIDATRFEAHGTLSRIRRRNAALTATVTRPNANDEHYGLFARYQNARHPGGGMDGMGRHEFNELMLSSPVDTFATEFRDSDGTLAAVMLADRISDGLSAVYSFFDPDRPRDGLGNYMIVWLAEHARAQGLRYVYLGYWIARSPKMAYKSRFRPLEALHPHQGWIPFEPEP